MSRFTDRLIPTNKLSVFLKKNILDFLNLLIINVNVKHLIIESYGKENNVVKIF